MTRFEILIERLNRLHHGSINADLMTVINAHRRVEAIKSELRHAEMALSHAMRGLEHPDYDATFAAWGG